MSHGMSHVFGQGWATPCGVRAHAPPRPWTSMERLVEMRDRMRTIAPVARRQRVCGCLSASVLLRLPLDEAAHTTRSSAGGAKERGARLRAHEVLHMSGRFRVVLSSVGFNHVKVSEQQARTPSLVLARCFRLMRRPEVGAACGMGMRWQTRPAAIRISGRSSAAGSEQPRHCLLGKGRRSPAEEGALRLKDAPIA